MELSWLTPLPWYVELVGSAMMADGADTSRSFFGDQERTVRGPKDLEYLTAAKQFFPLSEDWSLAWGVSGAFGPNPSAAGNRSAIYGSDVYLKYRPITAESSTVVSLTSEWFYRRTPAAGRHRARRVELHASCSGVSLSAGPRPLVTSTAPRRSSSKIAMPPIRSIPRGLRRGSGWRSRSRTTRRNFRAFGCKFRATCLPGVTRLGQVF